MKTSKGDEALALKGLPKGHLTISGEATGGGWPKGNLVSVYGGPDPIAADEELLSLMQLLLFPPQGRTSIRRTDTGPNVMRFEWVPGDKSAMVKIVYDPEKHDIEILQTHYSLETGNFFVITVENSEHIKVRQLPLKDYEHLTPREALKIFKHECKDDPRVQGM